MDTVESREPPESASRQRLFFALWPDRGCREALAALTRQSLPRRDGKAVPVENYHLTLMFLGAVTPPVRGCTERVADAISASPFVLRFEHVGYWPRPRVLWTAPAHTPGELLALVEALRRGASGCGLDPEVRPYRAHLTLARKVRSGLAQTPHAPIVWSIDAFHLIESHTLRTGARYHILRSWPLTGVRPTAPKHSAGGTDLGSPHSL